VPWNFFQLNSNYFNETKGIFSKLEMDKHIPDQWRLAQYYFDREMVPASYPVFLKPEWGQNSIGIVRINNKSEYLAFDRHLRQKTMPYIVQQTASGRIEFEIYYLRSPELPDDFAVLSITQVVNTSGVQHPINSIYNPNTAYLEISSTFSAQELQDIWNYLKAIGNFRMARVCLKADSKEDLLQGMFQIVEINLFLPMPLVLLAKNVREEKKQQLIEAIMMICARLVKTIPRNETGKSIFFRKMKAHYRSLQ
jgi:D-alanine-D-alanine ligase-like ATP-grasp enzyme